MLHDSTYQCLDKILFILGILRMWGIHASSEYEMQTELEYLCIKTRATVRLKREQGRAEKNRIPLFTW